MIYRENYSLLLLLQYYFNEFYYELSNGVCVCVCVCVCVYVCVCVHAYLYNGLRIEDARTSRSFKRWKQLHKWIYFHIQFSAIAKKKNMRNTPLYVRFIIKNKTTKGHIQRFSRPGVGRMMVCGICSPILQTCQHFLTKQSDHRFFNRHKTTSHDITPSGFNL